MGLFSFFFRSNKVQVQESNLDSSVKKTVEEFGDDNGAVPFNRDYGTQAHNLREALEVLHEAVPTLPGLNLFMDQQGFRSMNRSIRDMNEATRMNLLMRCETVSIINPLAVRGMTIRTDLVVSEGFKLESTASDKNNKQRIQDVLDTHWEYNRWDHEIFARVMDLGVMGELVQRVPPIIRKIGTVNPEIFNPGMFRCGLILPHLVRGCSLTPWNYEVLDRIFLQDYTYVNTALVPQGERSDLKIITDESIDMSDFGSIRGDVFYNSVNRRPGTTRGLSDLAHVVDWCDLYDKCFMSDVERAELMKRFIWDVTLENASEKQINEYARKLKIGGPAAGSVRVHNQKEVWDAIAPDLKMGDCNDLRDALMIHILGGLGLPKHWYADGSDSNRAVSDNMTDPTMAWARTRKRQVVQMLTLEARYAIQVAYEAGRLSGIPVEELGVRVVSRDPDRKGYEGVGASWKDIADSLTLLENSNLIDTESAANIVRMVLGSYGFEIDPKLLEQQTAQKQAQAQQAAQAAPGAQGIDPSTGQPVQPGTAAPGGPAAAPQVPPGNIKSANPLDAILNESNAWLERQKAEDRDLKMRW
jgi:hypothetical protein